MSKVSKIARNTTVVACIFAVCIAAETVADASVAPMSTRAARSATSQASHSRGYLTTPSELREIAEKAKAGVEPYSSAVNDVLKHANEPWSWSPISGEAKCQKPDNELRFVSPRTSSDVVGAMEAILVGRRFGEQKKPKARAPKPGHFKLESPEEPRYIAEGSVAVYAKALAYGLTGKEAYAAEVVSAIRGLMRINSFGGFGNTEQPVRQCQLNLSWYMPGFIRAADLIEDYPGWQSTKPEFQAWLANVVYPTVSFTAEVSVSNWGAAASNLTTYIADYLHDRADLRLVSYNVPSGSEPTTTRTPAQAYEHAIELTLGRMNGTRAEGRGGSSHSCDFDSTTKSMIRPDGGIPDDLRRGSSGCDASHIEEDDRSNMYSQTHLQNLIAQAELLRRRGDLRIYDNVANDSPSVQYADSRGIQHTVKLPAGRGSLRQAILFVLSQQRPRALRSACEVAYSYYRDPNMLNAALPARPNSGNRAMAFETLTSASARDEKPRSVPTVAPPR